MKVVLILFLFLLPHHQSNPSNQLNEAIICSLRSFVNSKTNSPLKTFENGICICKDGLPLDFPYDSLPDAFFYSVEHIHSYKGKYKRMFQEGVETLFVYPKLEGNRLLITISCRRVVMVNKKTKIFVSDCGIYCYEYSEEEKSWFFKGVKYLGV